MSKTIKFLIDKGFAKVGEVHTYADNIADPLIKNGYAEEHEVKAKPKKSLFKKSKDGGNE